MYFKEISANWTDYSVENFSENQKLYCEFKNLTPAKHYEARIILISDSNQSYIKEDVPKLHFKTECQSDIPDFN